MYIHVDDVIVFLTFFNLNKFFYAKQPKFYVKNKQWH